MVPYGVSLCTVKVHEVLGEARCWDVFGVNSPILADHKLMLKVHSGPTFPKYYQCVTLEND